MRISRALYDEMVLHARAEAPNECCGMVGSRDGEAMQVYRTTNAAASPLRFEIEPDEQFRVHQQIERSELELGAIYHSHTRTEPYPSQTDVNFAANWPGLEWVIVGLAEDEPQVRCYLIEDGQVRDVELRVR
jgi:[CysO sulfur-carrier protein]-S-L-cysteine hydrolase